MARPISACSSCSATGHGDGWRGRLRVLADTNEISQVRPLLKSVDVTGALITTDAAQVFLLRREVLDITQARISREFVFGITSRTAERIDPRQLNAAVRSHWGIENRKHLVRDVTFGEDDRQAHLGAIPQVLATLRNLALSLIRLAGSNEIKRTLQHIRRDRTRALDLIGLKRLHQP